MKKKRSQRNYAIGKRELKDLRELIEIINLDTNYYTQWDETERAWRLMPRAQRLKEYARSFDNI